MSAAASSAARVLIAEDEPSIAISLEFLMRGCGYSTRLAGDGEEALAALASFRPDIVILDIMLPSVSGLEIARRIRGDPAFARTRILMLTARGGTAEVVRGLATGADDYVVKPFSTHDLVVRVHALLERPAGVAGAAATGAVKP